MVKADELLKRAGELRPAKRTRLDAPQDREELNEVRRRRRGEHELNVARHPSDRQAWLRYIKWEQEWGSWETARPLYERCISGDLATDSIVWQRWAEGELRNKEIEAARQVLSRATTQIPKSTKLWLLWLRAEQASGSSVDVLREVFEKWLTHPTKEAWRAYIDFESKHGHASDAYERYVRSDPCLESWKGWALNSEHPRGVWTSAVDAGYTELARDWAWWEAENQEVERGRLILEHTGKFSDLVRYERAWGTSRNVTEARLKCLSSELASDCHQYDKWWEILDYDFSWAEKLVHAAPENNDRAKSDSWRLYVYLWLKVAFKRELEGIDPGDTYMSAARTVAPLVFTKLSLAHAKAEIRWGRIDKARKILGKALGLSKGRKKSLYRRYIDLEWRLRQPDRVRRLYQSWIEKFPFDTEPWLSYAEFEIAREENERARAIFAAAEGSVWREWAEWEADQGNYAGARSVYEKSPEPVAAAAEWAMLEIGLGLGPEDEEPDAESVHRARDVLVKADERLRHDPEKRYDLFEVRHQFEERYGDVSKLQEPHIETRVIAGKQIETYVFPDVDSRVSRLLTNARSWQNDRLAAGNST